jgi:hypothetical protein
MLAGRIRTLVIMLTVERAVVVGGRALYHDDDGDDEDVEKETVRANGG